MEKSRLIFSALVAFALTGCGTPEQIEDFAEAVQAESMPEGFTLPEDTQIASKTQVSTDAGEGVVILLDSEASVEELEEHFQAEAEAAGFTVFMMTNSRGEKQLRGDREDGLQFDFAAVSYQGLTTRASLAVGRESTD